jgi:predicted porin
MKKSLIALAVASAVAAPAAFAATSNVDVYGQLNVSVDVVDRDLSGLVAEEDEFLISSGSSRIGFKGAEDLGGGLSAIWQIESGINMDAGGGTWGSRNTFVGLSSKSLGTVKLGNHDTAYKMSTGKYDVFSDTLADYNAIMGAESTSGVIFDEREGNSISYETPSFTGVTGYLSYGQRNEAGSTSNDPQVWSLAVVYANGPLSLVAAYETHDETTEVSSSTADGTAWKIGAGYVFGNTRLAAIYERIESDFATGSNFERDSWYLSVAHQMGNITLKGAYGVAGETDFNGGSFDDGADMWALGLDYGLSKRTVVYALYTALDNDNLAQFGLSGGATTASGPLAGGTGNDQDGLSIGVKHSF